MQRLYGCQTDVFLCSVTFQQALRSGVTWYIAGRGLLARNNTWLFSGAYGRTPRFSRRTRVGVATELSPKTFARQRAEKQKEAR